MAALRWLGRLCLRGVRSRFRLHVIGVVLLTLLVRPEYLVRRARDNARECLAETRSARGPVLKNCAPIVRQFDIPTDYRYTRHDATYRAEELLARVAMDRYLDAAVGAPDPSRLAEMVPGMKRAQEMMENGSRRATLEELGRLTPSPHLGKLASSIGDRQALIRNYDYFGLWYTKRDVIDAAILEADFEEIEPIARYYAEWDPKEADQRTQLGALLCILSPEDGYRLLSDLPDQRAAKRYANIQRDYGEVLAVLHACAWKVGEVEPQVPSETHAGVADRAEVRLLTSLRKSAPGPERARRIKAAVEVLRGEAAGPGLDKASPNARAMILAAVLAASAEPFTTPDLLKMATPNTDGGESLLGPHALTLSRILTGPLGLHPVVPARELSLAARTVEARADDSSGETKSALERAAGGLHHLAAIELANAGDASAVGHAERGAKLLSLPDRQAALSIASTAYVAGDPDHALKVIEQAPSEGQQDLRAVTVGLSSLEAVLRARVGQAAKAAEVARRLPGEARVAAHPELALEARWLGLALARELGQRDGAPKLSSTGQADRLARYGERGEAAIAANLSAWASALEADGPQRRAFRFALLDARGDMPPVGLGYLLAAQQLLDAGTDGAATEVWLDAATTIDSRRMRFRTYAWLRMEAAKIRGDAEASGLWAERLSVLRALANTDVDLEATRFLRF